MWHSVANMLAQLSDRINRALARTTASGQFIPAVDGLRFIAIAAVVFHHLTAAYVCESHRFGAIELPRQWGDVVSQSQVMTAGYAGYFGVELFFVISGFIISLPYVRSYDFETKKPKIWSYYLRRLVRLDPPYILSLLVAFCIITLTHPEWRVSLRHLLASMLYLHALIYGTASSVSGVAWSLEVEIQFYLLVPLLSQLLVIRPIGLRRTILIVLTLSWAYAVGRFPLDRVPALPLSIVKFLQFFLAGFLLADLYTHYYQRIIRGFAGDLIAVTSASVIYWILTRYYELYWLTPLMTAVMYVGLVSGRIGSRIVTQRWIVTIGGMCYSIYLYHSLVINLLAPHSAKLMDSTRLVGLDLLLQAVVLIPPILILSAAFYVGVEKPCMRISRWIGKKFNADPVAS